MSPWNPIGHFLRNRREKRQFARMSMNEVFTHIYESNKWGGGESRSGKGSSLDQTRAIREALPALIRERQIRSLLDVPCGDFHWMREVPLDGVDYIGGDIVAEMIADNTARYARPGRNFQQLNLTSDALPRADLLLCRDCWVHLTFEDIGATLANIRRAGIPWLLATTFKGLAANTEKVRGKFRPLNLQIAPFHFPAPLQLIVEDNLESSHAAEGKSLGLWRVENLPARRTA